MESDLHHPWHVPNLEQVLISALRTIVFDWESCLQYVKHALQPRKPAENLDFRYFAEGSDYIQAASHRSGHCLIA